MLSVTVWFANEENRAFKAKNFKAKRVSYGKFATLIHLLDGNNVRISAGKIQRVEMISIP